jgi:hypothetical protein
MQDYARTKTDFVFCVRLTSSQQAVARSNYFDLLYNVAANEQGFPISEIASTNVYSAGRLPNSPFVMNSAAKEIARNQLQGIEYSDTYKSRKNPDLTDKIAMDAFASVKRYIPDKDDSMAATIIKSLTSSPNYVYVPGSFKAMIDLEIDISARSGVYVQKCARCGDYYIRDIDYDFDYCSRMNRDGTTCLELMKGEDPELAEAIAATAEKVSVETHDEGDPKIVYIDKDTVNAKVDQLYKEMAARVNVDMTQRDFSLWYQRALRLKDSILLGEAGEKELNEFIELSRGNEFASRKQAPLFEHKEEETVEEEEEITENGRHIKKFVFEKVEREPASLKTPSPAPSTLAESEKAAMEAVRRLFGSEQAKKQESPKPAQYAQQYDPAGKSAYGYPGQYPQPAQNVYGPQPPQQYGQFRPYYRPQRGQNVTRVIKSGTAPQTQDSAVRPKTVMIPNGTENSERPAFTAFADRQENAAPPVMKTVTSPKPEQVPVKPEPVPVKPEQEPDEDVKVFTPRRPSLSRTRQSDGYIEPSPYEKLKQPLEEYRDRVNAEEPPAEVEGQIVTDEIIRSAPSSIPANAAAAYRSYGNPAAGTEEDEFRKADFSHILEGINREDGFRRDEETVDSDGLPVSHKTKHVMNALFGPTKVSPILRVKLDEDDEDI